MADASGREELSEKTLEEILAAVASPAPTPGAGPVAAWTAAFAAALVEMVSAVELRKEPEDPAAAQERGERAGILRQRLLELARLDGEAYTKVLEVLRRREEPGHGARLRQALSEAADPPLEMAEIAGELLSLVAAALPTARGGVRGEALTAAALAEAVVRMLVPVIEMNLASQPDDPRRARVSDLAREAAGVLPALLDKPMGQ